jgi:MFS family permease
MHAAEAGTPLGEVSTGSVTLSAITRSIDRVDRALGGPERRRVLLVLAAVLGLAGADQATVGASATQLRHSLGLTHTDLGLIAGVSQFVAAVVAVPLGTLVDRINRTRMLAIGVLCWAVVMGVSAASQSFTQLVLIRCALGGAVAIAAPASASLVGDYFAPEERGRIWGYVLTGELIGTGLGFTVAGSLAAVSWRASFAALALPALLLARFVRRLPEPARGGAGHLAGGDAPATETAGPVMSRAQQAMMDEAQPYPELVIETDPSGWPLRRAVRYVLRVRTNVVLILAGSAGYFFFAGARAFGIEYVKQQYGVGQTVASTMTLVLGLFAVAGVLASGQLSDRWGLHGHPRARVYVAAAMLAVATVMFLPALLVTSFGAGVVLLGAAAFALAAVNPPVDAGRLDIMPPALWGRAEAVRSLVKQPAEATAPLVFGLLADHLEGGGQAGLQATFLVMLVPLAASVFLVLRARRTYARDVATAALSIERTYRR